MKDNQLVPALNDEGFIVSVYEGVEIEDKLNIKNRHDKVLVVNSEDMTQAKAELAYGINKTDIGLELNHYNKHCDRTELALTYTLIFENEELMWSALLIHVKRTSKILINLSQNNTVTKERIEK